MVMRYILSEKAVYSLSYDLLRGEFLINSCCS
jgi:hypothetical protein